MPRQNRVTPFSAIVATPERGRWLGNRGCIHDDAGQIRRLYQSRRWIICVLKYKDWRRPLMQPGRWTELFFLDEVTALSAGHRPCAFCRREYYEAYRSLFAKVNAHLGLGERPSAEEMDTVLHAERLDGRRQRVTFAALFGTLPDGSFVAQDGAAHLVRAGALWPWSPAGYGPPVPTPADATVAVLTPRSSVGVLALGYAAQMDEA